LDQEIIFRGADFDWIKAIDDSEDRCEDIKMTVGNGSLELVYYLPLPGAKFDVDLKEVPMKAKINDAYRCILDSWEDEFNLLDYGDPVTITTYVVRGVLEYETVTPSVLIGTGGVTIDEYLGSPDLPTNDPTDTNWIPFIISFNDPFTGVWEGFITYVREVTTTTCVAGVPVPPAFSGAWSLRSNDCGTLGTAIYSFLVPLGQPVEQISTDIIRYTRYRLPGLIDNGRRLFDVLQQRLDETCDIDVKSRLFTRNVAGLPVYSNSVYDQKQNIEHLIIFQRSDIKRPDASINATKGMTTIRTYWKG
jgi:hypothetical protein